MPLQPKWGIKLSCHHHSVYLSHAHSSTITGSTMLLKNPISQYTISLSSWQSSWEQLHPQSNDHVLKRLPSSTHREDRFSVISDPIQWLWATSGWVFQEVISSLMEACKLQQQLHGNALNQEYCMRCGRRISSVVHVTMLKSGGHPDTALISASVIWRA